MVLYRKTGWGQIAGPFEEYRFLSWGQWRATAGECHGQMCILEGQVWTNYRQGDPSEAAALLLVWATDGRILD